MIQYVKLLLFSCSILFISNITIAQSAALISTNLAKSDIEQMVSTFEKVHYNPYFKTSRQEFNRQKKELLDRWATDSISYKQFMVAGMKLSAIMSGGHSYMYWQNAMIIPEVKAHLYIPFTGTLTDNNQSFVITKTNDTVFPHGTRIKSINGIDIVELFQECMSYTGGIDAFKMANTEKIFPLHLFFNDSLHAPYSIEILNSDTPISTNGIDIRALAEFINSSEVRVDYSFEILKNKIGLISYNSCNNYRKFDKFLKETFKTIHQENIDKLIIDIRENGGGDSRLNDLLLSYITTKPYQQSSGRYWKVSEESKKAYSENKVYEKMFGKEFMETYMNTPNQEIIESMDTTELVHPLQPKNFFEGKSCMLIGPSTFSSANFLADAVKTYRITTLIGNPTGEYTNDFGEQLSFTLTNSKSTVYISSTYDIGANGNASLLEPVYPDIETKADALKYAIQWLQDDVNYK